MGDPWAEVVNTIECIRPATSAWNVPWDNSDNMTGNGQRTARISLADTLSSHGECADFVIENELSVSGSVTSTAISIGQSCGCQSLKIVWCGSSLNGFNRFFVFSRENIFKLLTHRDGSTSPSSNNSVDATTSVCTTKSNCLDIRVESDWSGCFDDSNTEKLCNLSTEQEGI